MRFFRMRSLLIIPIVAVIAAVAVPLAAQQAGADYDQTAVVTLEGTADTIEWSEAGGKLVLQPTTGGQMWDIILPNTATLLKKGVSASQMIRGTPVKVRAYRAKDAACTPNCKAQGIDLVLNGGGQTFDLLSPVAPDPAPAAGGPGQGGGRGRRGG
jgi:hypothetical protein